MTTAATLVKMKDTIVSATNAIMEQIRGTRARLVDLRQRQQRTELDPLPPGDVTRRNRRAVTESGEYFMKVHGEGIARALRSPLADDFSTTDYGRLMTWPAYCAAFPDQACAFLDALGARVPYEAGLPIADRPPALEQLQHEIDKLEAADEDAVDQAAAAGVHLEHRPEVLERRTRSARQRELEEEAVTDRRLRQEAIDADRAERATRPRAGESQYLKTGHL